VHPIAALRRIPRYPLEAFFWSRLAIWGATLLAYLVFEAQYAQPLHTNGAEDVVEHDVGWAVDVWGRWDSGWYLQIAHHGYADPGETSAFFPAYPLLVRVVGWFLLGHDLLAGVLVSLAASAVAFVLLWRLAGTLAGDSAARRSLLYLAFFPTTLFLFAVYSESLYLMLSVGV
jgi:Mannosyltransferase (PIG-V)